MIVCSYAYLFVCLYVSLFVCQVGRSVISVDGSVFFDRRSMSNMDVLSWMCQPSVLRSMIGHNIKVGLNEFEGRLGGDKDLYQDILCSGLIICTHVSVSRTQNLLNPATFESAREAQLTQNFKSLRGQSLDSSLLTPNLQTLNPDFQIPNPTLQNSNPQFPNPKTRTPNLEPKIFKTRIPNPRPQNHKSRNSNRKPQTD